MKRLLRRLDDALNPIVVRELRQAVQGRALAAILIVFLAAEVVFLGSMVILSSVAGPAAESLGLELGKRVFTTLNGVLLFVSLLFVPLYTAIRMVMERSDSNLDLLFVTTLRPRSIIAGKLCAGVLLTGLLFCASLPFMTFTYFLRGIDLPSVFVVLALGFLSVVTCVQLSILVAALPGSRIFKILLGLVGLNALMSFFIYTLVASYALLEMGVGSLLDSWKFWGPALAVTAAYLVLIGLCFVLSVAVVMPPAANRALPVRIFLFGAWLLSGAAAAGASTAPGTEEAFTVWLVVSLALLALTLIGAVSERERLGPRVARTVPANGLKRRLAFLLYSGNAGGVLFALGLIAATLLIGLLYISWRGPLVTGDLMKALLVMAGISAYAFGYAMSGLLLRSRVGFLRRRVPAGYTWLVSLILVVLGSWGPVVLAFLVLRKDLNGSSSFYPWLALNPFSLVDGAHRTDYLRVAGVFAGGVLVLSLPWLARRWREFDALGRNPAPPALPRASRAA